MTTLKEIALTLKENADSYVPMTVPLWMARLGTASLEVLARLTRTRPIMTRVQIEFITKGLEPRSDKAIQELSWEPLSLDEGIKRYLKQKRNQREVST